MFFGCFSHCVRTCCRKKKQKPILVIVFFYRTMTWWYYTSWHNFTKSFNISYSEFKIEKVKSLTLPFFENSHYELWGFKIIKFGSTIWCIQNWIGQCTMNQQRWTHSLLSVWVEKSRILFPGHTSLKSKFVNIWVPLTWMTDSESPNNVMV